MSDSKIKIKQNQRSDREELEKFDSPDGNKVKIRQIHKSDQEELEKFVSLERELLGEYSNFVPRIDDNVIYQLSGESPFFSEMDHTMFIASDGSEDVARCAALINHKYQKAKNEAVGFIGYFAAAPDKGPLVKKMFEQAEAWLKERGVKRIIAPYDGSYFIGMTIRTAAFDEKPIFPMMWHPPYYKDYMTEAGYQPSYPFWSFRVDFSSENFRATVQQVKENNTAQVRPLKKDNWEEELEIRRQIINEAFKDEWEHHPLSREEILDFFNPLKEFIDPKQMLIAEINGKPVGMCLGFPDLNGLWKKFNGSIDDVEEIRRAFNNYSRAGLIVIAVIPEAQGKGVGKSLATTLFQRYQEQGLNEAAYHVVNEVNEKSRNFAESLCCEGRKLFHCYDKIIA